MADHTMTVIMSDYIVLGGQNDHHTKVHGAANELCSGVFRRLRTHGGSRIHCRAVRLAALVPRPLLHLIRFHGVLAPDASLRLGLVPALAERHRARRPIARIRLALR